MTVDPEVKFGIRDGGRTGAKTLEQKFSLVAGLVYLGIGLVGFVVTGFNDLVGTSNEAFLGIFALNPFHNIVHIAIGALWLLAALALTPPATEGVNFAIGGIYLLAAVLGFLGYLALMNVGNHADPDNFLHLGTGLVALLFAGPLRVLGGRSLTA
ncbi:MAG TPA: DUF4383 domain-containing protein [Pseudonocardiaceae bacterium]|nr:DUF4383 domain-containing protein [Pseudonocardiaceae bacterium]